MFEMVLSRRGSYYPSMLRSGDRLRGGDADRLRRDDRRSLRCGDLFCRVTDELGDLLLLSRRRDRKLAEVAFFF
jgi:hypothetical protein